MLEIKNAFIFSAVALGLYCSVFNLLARTDTVARLYSPFPVYSDTDLDNIPPYNREGTIKLIQLVSKFKSYRNQFLDEVLSPNIHGVKTILDKSLIEISSEDFVVSTALAILVILIPVISIIFLVGSRLKLNGVFNVSKEYECGIDALLISASTSVTITNFRLAVLFTIFEVEVIFLFILFPNSTLLGTAGIIIVFFLLFLFQLVLLLEARSGTLTHKK